MKKIISISLLVLLFMANFKISFAQTEQANATPLDAKEVIPPKVVAAYKALYKVAPKKENVEKYMDTYQYGDMYKIQTVAGNETGIERFDNDWFDKDGKLTRSEYNFNGIPQGAIEWLPKKAPIPAIFTAELEKFKAKVAKLAKEHNVKNKESFGVGVGKHKDPIWISSNYVFDGISKQKTLFLTSYVVLDGGVLDFSFTLSVAIDEKGTVVKRENKEFTLKSKDAPKLIEENVVYLIKSVKSGKVLEIADGNTKDGGKLIQANANGNDSQKFILQKIVATDGRQDEYVIINKKSKKALSGQGNQADQIIQFTKDGGERQVWRIDIVGEKNVRLSLKYSGRVADVAEGSTEAGAKIWEYGWNDTDAQKWILEKSK